MYHLNHFQVYSSVVLSIFTLLGNRSLEPFYLANLNLYPLNSSVPFPLLGIAFLSLRRSKTPYLPWADLQSIELCMCVSLPLDFGLLQDQDLVSYFPVPSKNLANAWHTVCAQ